MDEAATQASLEFGDQVRHLRRPEWGIGSVAKVEQVSVQGQAVIRITVRFPNEGIKVLTMPPAEIVKVTAADTLAAVAEPEPPVSAMMELDRMRDSGWLGNLPQRKIDEVMTSLSQEVKDPFNTPQRRLALTLAMYRFNKTGKGLLEWAVSQSGLNDPLARFSRPELERYFDRWAFERENHLNRLLQELKHDRASIDSATKTCPPAGAAAVQRLLTVR